MNKIIKDGRVAVLYSPQYGAGWYTWNTKFAQCLFEPVIVELALQLDDLEKQADKNKLSYTERKKFLKDEKRLIAEKIEILADELYGADFYAGGAMSLSVAWIDEGQQFKVDEYDGFESIKYAGDEKYLIA